MRVTAAYSTVLCAILCQQAWADDPRAPAEKGAEKGAANDAEHKAAPEAASAVVNPGVTVVGAKPGLTPAEKQLIAKGYKLEMRQGEKYFCRREQQLGSRFEVKTCDTAQSIESRRLESQEAVRVIQSDRPLSNH